MHLVNDIKSYEIKRRSTRTIQLVAYQIKSVVKTWITKYYTILKYLSRELNGVATLDRVMKIKDEREMPENHRYISNGDPFEPKHDANMITKFLETHRSSKIREIHTQLQNDLVEHHWPQHFVVALYLIWTLSCVWIWIIWFVNFNFFSVPELFESKL